MRMLQVIIVFNLLLFSFAISWFVAFPIVNILLNVMETQGGAEGVKFAIMWRYVFNFTAFLMVSGAILYLYYGATHRDPYSVEARRY